MNACISNPIDRLDPHPDRSHRHHHETNNVTQGGAGWGGDRDGAGKAKAKATPAVVLERMDVFTKLHDEDKVCLYVGGGRIDRWAGGVDVC